MSRPNAPSGTRRRLGGRLDAADAAILAGLTALSVWVLGWLIERAQANGRVWTGIDGLHATDPLQYLAWIRDAAHSVLVSNLFELRPSAASFLHPGFLISGLITRLGVTPWLAYLLWKPVAVLVLFFGVRAYARRFLTSVGGRRAALLLAFFFVSTAAFLASELTVGAKAHLYLLGIEVELWPGTWLWGYSFTVLAVAAIPVVLLLYERDRARGRIGAWAPLLALTCSWFQPWQGTTLLGILVVGELIARPPAGVTLAFRARQLVTTVLAGAAPLIYYAALEKLDPSWTLSASFNRFGGWPVWTLFVSLVPLGLPAALAYARPTRDFGEVAVRAWPVMGLAVYWVIALTGLGTFPIHALQGLTIPLAILAVTGVQTRVTRRDRIATLTGALAVALAIIPALVWKLNDARDVTASIAVVFPGAPPNVFSLAPAEDRALSYLAREPVPGGVLASAYMGEITPARTGRRTWVGLPSWTPDYGARDRRAESLFDGTLTATASMAFVRSTGARFVLTDCMHPFALAPRLAPLVLSVKRFGCSSVLRVR